MCEKKEKALFEWDLALHGSNKPKLNLYVSRTFADLDNIWGLEEDLSREGS